MSNEVKTDRRYTSDHEWTLSAAGGVTIGITAHAVDQLGDITMVNIDVEVGDSIEAGKPFGTVESVKTLADLFAPVAGTVSAINGKLEEEPELVNDDCYGEGWLVAITPNDASAVDGLLDPAAYEALLSED